MRSYIIAISSIGLQDAAQMCLAKNNEMVRALAPDRSDQSFGKAVLPRRSRYGRLVPDTYGSQSASDDCAVNPMNADDVARRPIPKEGLG